MYNLTDPVNLMNASVGVDAFNMAHNLTLQPAVVVYQDKFEIALALLALIAFCQVFFLLNIVRRWVLSWIE